MFAVSRFWNIGSPRLHLVQTMPNNGGIPVNTSPSKSHLSHLVSLPPTTPSSSTPRALLLSTSFSPSLGNYTPSYHHAGPFDSRRLPCTPRDATLRSFTFRPLSRFLHIASLKAAETVVPGERQRQVDISEGLLRTQEGGKECPSDPIHSLNLPPTPPTKLSCGSYTTCNRFSPSPALAAAWVSAPSHTQHSTTSAPTTNNGILPNSSNRMSNSHRSATSSPNPTKSIVKYNLFESSNTPAFWGPEVKNLWVPMSQPWETEESLGGKPANKRFLYLPPVSFLLPQGILSPPPFAMSSSASGEPLPSSPTRTATAIATSSDKFPSVSSVAVIPTAAAVSSLPPSSSMNAAAVFKVSSPFVTTKEPSGGERKGNKRIFLSPEHFPYIRQRVERLSDLVRFVLKDMNKIQDGRKAADGGHTKKAMKKMYRRTAKDMVSWWRPSVATEPSGVENRGGRKQIQSATERTEEEGEGIQDEDEASADAQNKSSRNQLRRCTEWEQPLPEFLHYISEMSSSMGVPSICPDQRQKYFVKGHCSFLPSLQDINQHFLPEVLSNSFQLQLDYRWNQSLYKLPPVLGGLAENVKSSFCRLCVQISNEWLLDIHEMTNPPKLSAWHSFLDAVASHLELFARTYSKFEIVYCSQMHRLLHQAFEPLSNLVDDAAAVLQTHIQDNEIQLQTHQQRKSSIPPAVFEDTLASVNTGWDFSPPATSSTPAAPSVSSANLPLSQMPLNDPQEEEKKIFQPLRESTLLQRLAQVLEIGRFGELLNPSAEGKCFSLPSSMPSSSSLSRPFKPAQRMKVPPFNPLLLTKARNVTLLLCKTFSGVDSIFPAIRIVARYLLTVFHHVCQTMVDLREDIQQYRLNPTFRCNPRLAETLMELELTWRVSENILNADALKFAHKLVDSMDGGGGTAPQRQSKTIETPTPSPYCTAWAYPQSPSTPITVTQNCVKHYSSIDLGDTVQRKRAYRLLKKQLSVQNPSEFVMYTLLPMLFYVDHLILCHEVDNRDYDDENESKDDTDTTIMEESEDHKSSEKKEDSVFSSTHGNKEEESHLFDRLFFPKREDFEALRKKIRNDTREFSKDRFLRLESYLLYKLLKNFSDLEEEEEKGQLENRRATLSTKDNLKLPTFYEYPRRRSRTTLKNSTVPTFPSVNADDSPKHTMAEVTAAKTPPMNNPPLLLLPASALPYTRLSTKSRINRVSSDNTTTSVAATDDSTQPLEQIIKSTSSFPPTYDPSSSSTWSTTNIVSPSSSSIYFSSFLLPDSSSDSSCFNGIRIPSAHDVELQRFAVLESYLRQAIEMLRFSSSPQNYDTTIAPSSHLEVHDDREVCRRQWEDIFDLAREEAVNRFTGLSYFPTASSMTTIPLTNMATAFTIDDNNKNNNSPFSSSPSEFINVVDEKRLPIRMSTGKVEELNLIRTSIFSNNTFRQIERERQLLPQAVHRQQSHLYQILLKAKGKGSNFPSCASSISGIASQQGGSRNIMGGDES